MKNWKGFTLIEVILSLFILSILLVVINSFLSLSLSLSKASEEKLYSLQDMRYTLDKIYEDILQCDRVIPSEKIDNLRVKGFDDNFGFIIVKSVDNETDNYTLYYKDKSYKNIKRVSTSKPKGVLPSYNNFAGYNELSGLVKSIDGSGLDVENKMIRINLTILNNKEDEITFHREILLSCPIDN